MPWLNFLGLDAHWLSLIVGLIVIPSIYISFALDVQKEYGELIRVAIEKRWVLTKEETVDLHDEVETRISFFQLDWWVIGAIGVLMFAIAACGELAQFSTYIVRVPIGHHSDTIQNTEMLKGVHQGIFIYTIAVGLLIIFRIAWARLSLARALRQYYKFRPCPPDEAGKQDRNFLMPPSGYSRPQSQSVVALLSSCADALEDEAHSDNITYNEALDKELVGIRNHLREAPVSPAQESILKLTEEFYKAVRAQSPSSKVQFWEAVRQAANEIGAQVLAIQV
ncbi:MAG: hypothetical protein C5B44_05180 [Acidobacteria bacterium]|nr:MAG: hypothetical protein C5B44_05180 [Acidobacteriota bacterium]